MKQHSGNKNFYPVIGMMSGTSLDGLDIAACLFQESFSGWKYEIIVAETIDYSPEWDKKLRQSHTLSGEELTMLDRQYGVYLGQQVRRFLSKHGIIGGLVASHGHTVFHLPGKGCTLQIGHGAYIAAETGLPAVTDFRSTDIALSGQGAPLVPIGDKLLFGEYSFCLNLGGFANLSFDQNGERKAGDICPANIVLNYLASKHGHNFDKNGDHGRNGIINHELLNALNNLDFYNTPLPRSLGREWVDEYIFPLFRTFPDSTNNHLRTFYEHIALQISRYIVPNSIVLITGGGAFNVFILERLSFFTGAELYKPSDQLIKFKEALIFAFIGHLRFTNKTNCLKSVTGASRDSCCGALYLP